MGSKRSSHLDDPLAASSSEEEEEEEEKEEEEEEEVEQEAESLDSSLEEVYRIFMYNVLGFI